MTAMRAAFCAALFLWILPLAAAAQDVTLTSRDGSLVLSGTLLSYDGELYRIETEFGELTVDGAGVRCDGPGCPDLAGFVSEFRISGSRTMGEVLVPALVESFAARRGYRITREVIDDIHFRYVLHERQPAPGAEPREIARISFRVSSSAEGFADLLADEADIVLSTRQINRTEARLAREAELGDMTSPRRSRIIALDALVPVVARGNPVGQVSLEDLALIFSGEVDDWAALGGPEGPISLHLRDGVSGLTQEFLRRVMAPAGVRLAQTVTFHDSNAALSDAVARDPGAIGIAAFSEIGNARPLDIVGPCGKRARATPAALLAEDYPLTLPLFVYTPARRPAPVAREFLNFARSNAAQPVIARAGFVDLRLREVPLAEQGQRLANAIAAAGEEVGLDELKRMVKAMDGTARLSLSFRFEPGGTRLDAQSRSSVEILGRELESGQFDDLLLSVVGFSDGLGAASANRRLAQRRAEAVRRAVLRAAPAADRERIELQVDAFGEAMPMACDETGWGRHINRRVEVWVHRQGRPGAP